MLRELSDVRCPIFDVQCSVLVVPCSGGVGNEGGIETRYYEGGKDVEAYDGRADGVGIKRGQVE